MWLLVDIGNTRIKWRWSYCGNLFAGGAEPLPSEGSEGLVFSRLWGSESPPANLMVSNVAGERIRDALREWSLRQWRAVPIFVTPVQETCGVTNAYDEPDTLGVDRWCGLIGARVLVPDAVCVVDCGTAITVDVMSAEGVHLGGLIAPGLSTMVRALTKTALGPRAEVAFSESRDSLGRSTSECIRSGILAAAAGLVDHAVERLAPRGSSTLVTGGDAILLAKALQRQVRVEPELLFHGLARLTTLGIHA